MLRITIHDNPEVLTFQLEGKLAGPGSGASGLLAEHADQPAASAVRFDLTEVTRRCRRKAVPGRHARQGAELVAAGCLMKAMVAEITSNLCQLE